MATEVVKLQERLVRGIPHYSVTIPTKYVKKLGWAKGDLIAVKENEIEGKKGLFLYKVVID